MSQQKKILIDKPMLAHLSKAGVKPPAPGMAPVMVAENKRDTPVQTFNYVRCVAFIHE
ncbi:hypothetical protein D3C72_2331290 [compost metagenome]